MMFQASPAFELVVGGAMVLGNLPVSGRPKGLLRLK